MSKLDDLSAAISEAGVYDTLEAPKPPNPGSAEAVARGCVCPVIDNGHGRGYMGGVKGEDGNTVFVWREDCPLHGTKGDTK